MSNLSDKDKELLLKEFPKQMKLSYKNHYKKVLNYDLVYAIPEGKNAFVWFTHFNGQDLCIVLEVNQCEKIENIYIQNTCFDYKLCFGTILYGTLFKCKGYTHFTMEDIFYYKGKNMSSIKLSEKLELYSFFFQYDISPHAYNKSFLVIGLPLICWKEEESREKIKALPYKIRYLEYRYFNNTSNHPILYLQYNISIRSECHNYTNNNHSNNKCNNYTNPNSSNYNSKNNSNYKKDILFHLDNKNKKRDIVFQVRPDIQNDIYHLYIDNGSKYHSIAYIPDYKTSVKMNELFRNIKENANLDTLEESDDEEEFQNEKQDKYVFLDKYYNMVCYYSYKFKKWIPQKIANEHSKIIESKELLHVEKNKY